MKRSFNAIPSCVAVTSALLIAVVSARSAFGQLRIEAVWGYSQLIDIQNQGLSPVDLSNYQIATSDLDQPDEAIPVGAMTGITIPAFGHLLVYNTTVPFPTCNNCTAISASNWTIASPLPFQPNLASGPYSLGLYNSGPIEAFVQIKVSGGSAAGFHSSAVDDAIAAGLWSNSDAFIEYEAQFAGYELNSLNPMGPADYRGFVIPEPTAAALLLWGIVANAASFHRAFLRCRI
jgi:hypothetical protein